MTDLAKMIADAHSDDSAIQMAFATGLRIRSTQGYNYEVTAVGRWFFMATHADDAEPTEFQFAIDGWRQRFEVIG